MQYLINDRKPASVFHFFEEISQIPRPSYHEEKIADYLVDFAKSRGLEYVRDDTNNVLIKRPASAGLEASAPILLQGHTDMVCEKNADVEHDFLKDPLRLRTDGRWLRATGTTLGADNGIAVAMMLAILDGEIASHPAIGCLFTSSEETGMDGVINFDYSLIASRTLVNMDSEAIGTITAGCAGGFRTDLDVACKAIPFAGQALRISISGLMGGHSGVNINDGRANANRLMGRLLSGLAGEQEIFLVSLEGGSKTNAIPRECEAVIAVADAEAAEQTLASCAAGIATELSAQDRGFRMLCEDDDAAAVMFDAESTRKVIAVLSCVQNGVLAMSNDVKGLVEFSRNLGVIKTEGDVVSFLFSTRSSLGSQLQAAMDEMTVFASVLGASVKNHNSYPGWSYAKESAVRDAYIAAYRDVTGKDAVIDVIHAGLECGVIASKLPDMDMISIGPDMKDIHSPDEALDLASVEVFWQTVERLIERLK